jgi:parvulin-like peptidyl-prolyl isomerase
MENIKKANTRIMIITGIIVIFLFLFFKYSFKFENGKIIARINNIDIPYTEYWAYTSKIPRKLTDKDKMLALDWIVNQNLIGLYAEKSPEIQKQLTPIFEKEELYAKKDLLLRLNNIEQVERKVNVTDDQLKEFYFNNKLYNLYYIAISRIDPKADVKAREAYLKLEQGNSFNDVFKEFSDEKLQKSEGKLGVFLEAEIPPPFDQHIRKLKFEESFTEPFSAEYGTFILYRGNDKTFDEIKDEIKIRVEKVVKQQTYNNLFIDAKSKISINKEFLSSISMIKSFDEKIKSFDGTPIVTLSDKKTIIYFKKFREELEDLFQWKNLVSKTPDQLIEKAEQLGVQEEMYQNALSSKLDKSEKFEKEWRKIRLNLDESKSQKTIQWVLENIITKELKVSKKEILDYYMQNRDEFKKSDLYKLQKVIVKNKSEADSIYAKAQRGDKFSRLVLKYSLEDNVDRTLGRTAYLGKNELEAHWDTIKQYGNAEVISPIKTSDGFIVYKVLDFQKGAQLTYEQAETSINNIIFVQKLTTWLEKIQKEYDIKVEKFYDVVLEASNES